MISFSRNSGLMVKTFLYQVVMSLFGVMMYGATYKIPFLLVIGQATVVLFYYYIMSSQMYKSGAKMCEYDRGHDSATSPAAGFLFALIAYLPTVLLALVSVLVPPFAQDGATNTAGYLSYLGNHTFLQGMYIGITQTIYPTMAGGASETLAAANAAAINSRCIIHLIGAFPGIIACGVGYLLGYQNFKRDKKNQTH